MQRPERVCHSCWNNQRDTLAQRARQCAGMFLLPIDHDSTTEIGLSFSRYLKDIHDKMAALVTVVELEAPEFVCLQEYLSRVY